MKKLIMVVATMCALTAAVASEYMVYDFTMTAKTTKAKGKIGASCSDTCVWRDAGSQKIRGVIAGCGCESVLANGSCINALVLLWNETTKQQITDYELSTWIVQRIGKKDNKAEHIAKITCDDFEVTLAGLGTYSKDHLNVSGNFAGFAGAPYLVTPGARTACSEEPDEIDQSIASAPCAGGLCDEADNSAITPFFGSYTLKYNASKSKSVSNNGLTAKTLGAPTYVDIEAGYFEE